MGFKFKVFYRGGGEKGLTMEVECNGSNPYDDRQRHSNIISVPNCNASGINEHLIPEFAATWDYG
jgi:hypothetical protein